MVLLQYRIDGDTRSRERQFRHSLCPLNMLIYHGEGTLESPLFMPSVTDASARVLPKSNGGWDGGARTSLSFVVTIWGGGGDGGGRGRRHDDATAHRLLCGGRGEWKVDQFGADDADDADAPLSFFWGGRCGDNRAVTH